MTTRELTCVVCPAGCRLTVTLDDAKVIKVEGNTCARGKTYAENEITNPVRTLTSTVVVITKNGKKLLPVRTDKPISKEVLFDAMKIIRSITITAPVKTGDIIVKDFIEPGINLVSCKDETV